MNSTLKQIKPDKIQNINPNKETLTTEKLKTLMHGDLTDEEAAEVVLSVKKLVSIIVDFQYEIELKQHESTEQNIKQAA